LARLNVLFGKGVRIGKEQLQGSNSPAFMKQRRGNQRSDASVPAFFALRQIF
jgi:hypothetical protein